MATPTSYVIQATGIVAKNMSNFTYQLTVDVDGPHKNDGQAPGRLELPVAEQLLDHAQGRTVQLAHFRRRGFTLIEVLITISIAILLIYLAMPNFLQFFANTQIRTAAETINNGMKQAQGQAIKLNTPVQFVLDSTSLPTKYQILDSNNVQLDQAIFQAGSTSATFVVTPAGATRATFSGLGQIMATNPFDPITPNSAGITRIDVSAPSSGSVRKLAVVSDITKGVKLCDPLTVVPDPKACP